MIGRSLVFTFFGGLALLGYKQVADLSDLNRGSLDGCYAEFADGALVPLDAWVDHPLNGEKAPFRISCYFKGKESHD